jgi:hypothetical protein
LIITKPWVAVAPIPLSVAFAPLFAALARLNAAHFPFFGAHDGLYGQKLENEEQTNGWLALIFPPERRISLRTKSTRWT